MKVLLVVIDAATPHVVCPAIRTGRLPTLQRLADAGAMHEASVIDLSVDHAGRHHLDHHRRATRPNTASPARRGTTRRGEEVAYYGDDFWVIAREGFGDFLNDFLLRLNGDRLRAPTLFEMVERTGRTAACLNYLVFRGIHAHEVRMPGRDGRRCRACR